MRILPWNLLQIAAWKSTTVGDCLTLQRVRGSELCALRLGGSQFRLSPRLLPKDGWERPKYAPQPSWGCAVQIKDGWMHGWMESSFQAKWLLLFNFTHGFLRLFPCITLRESRSTNFVSNSQSWSPTCKKNKKNNNNNNVQWVCTVVCFYVSCDWTAACYPKSPIKIKMKMAIENGRLTWWSYVVLYKSKNLVMVNKTKGSVTFCHRSQWLLRNIMSSMPKRVGWMCWSGNGITYDPTGVHVGWCQSHIVIIRSLTWAGLFS